MNRKECAKAVEPAAKRARTEGHTPLLDDAAEVKRIVDRAEPASELAQKLHPHQRDAVLFVLRRLTFSYEGIVTQAGHDAIPNTGAILADEMGTGKTIVSLVAIATICKSLSCKCVVVTPLTLVGNWMSEVQKWFPRSLARSAISIGNVAGRSSKALDDDVRRFVTSHASVHPLLILSYEMFRVYAAALNTMTNLELLVCDEGHRIKNAMGTKTTALLGNCCAMRRLVLTGTPLQNNLDELYAVVQFVAPGYLNELTDFQQDYANPILAGRRGNADLTARADGDRAEEALRQRLAPLILRRTKRAVLQQILPPCFRMLVGVQLTATDREQYEAVANALVDEDKPGSAGDASTSWVLSRILKARLCCSDQSQAKLQVCSALLAQIVQRGEKAVVVSNFSSTLDAVRNNAREHGWGTLRIDGSVDGPKRLRIAQFFNSSDRGFPVLLLSARAGGLGLNLIGASRLIMVDADWNPATDEQAMARVWRQGQQHTVHIYRLFAVGTVEQSILLRQKDKGYYQRLVSRPDEDRVCAETDPGLDQDSDERQARVFLSGQTMRSILWPETSAAGAVGTPRDVDPVLQAVRASVKAVHSVGYEDGEGGDHLVDAADSAAS